VSRPISKWAMRTILTCLVIALSVLLALAWFSSRDRRVPSAQTGEGAAQGLPAVSVTADTPSSVDRTAVSAQDGESDGGTQSSSPRATLLVRCRSESGADLPGIRVSLFRAPSNGEEIHAASDPDGLVRFPDLHLGDYLICCADPERKWSVVTEAKGPFPQIPVSVAGDVQVTCTFSAFLVARVRFHGDELIAVATGRHTPGITHAVEASGVVSAESRFAADGRVMPNCDRPIPPDHEFFFRSRADTPAPSLTVRAMTMNHGVVEVSVPIQPVDAAAPPMEVDLRAYPGSAAAQVLFEVRDAAGRDVDIGLITLRAREHAWLRLQCRPNTLRFVPSGLSYSVSVGDFPLAYQMGSEPELVDLRPADVRVVSIPIAIETTFLKPVLTRGGKPLAPDELVWCSVQGDFPPGCRGQAGLLARGGRLPWGAYPNAVFDLVIRTSTREDRVAWPLERARAAPDVLEIEIP
jgi:hypothetical protein